jgi:RNA recognition motif-containing protein
MVKRKNIETELEPEVDYDAHNEQQQEDDTISKKEIIKSSEKKKVAPQGPKKRYIVFVGNLPYSTSKEDLEKIFEGSCTFYKCFSIDLQLFSSKFDQITH